MKISEEIEDIIKQEEKIFKNRLREGHFWFTEFDEEINELQRKKIEIIKNKAKQERKNYYVVNINKNEIVNIFDCNCFNFCGDMIIEEKDKNKVEDILKRYHKAKIEELTKILKEFEKIEHIILCWV